MQFPGTFSECWGGGPQEQRMNLPMIMLISVTEENRCQELLKMYLDSLQLVYCPVRFNLSRTVFILSSFKAILLFI